MQKEIIVHSKSFYALLNDAEFFLEEARELDNRLKNMSKTDKQLQKVLRRKRSYSRSCLILCVAALESFVHIALLNYSKRDIDVIRPEWISSRMKKKSFEDWMIEAKIRFLPVLCNRFIKPPDYYFSTNSKEYNKLVELRKIRNKIAHGAVVDIKLLISGKSGTFHLASDNYNENKWPLTGIERDIQAIDLNDASIAHQIVLSIMKKLRKSLGRQFARHFLTDQEFDANGQKGRLRREYDEDFDPQWVNEIMKD